MDGEIGDAAGGAVAGTAEIAEHSLPSRSLLGLAHAGGRAGPGRRGGAAAVGRGCSWRAARRGGTGAPQRRDSPGRKRRVGNGRRRGPLAPEPPCARSCGRRGEGGAFLAAAATEPAAVVRTEGRAGGFHRRFR